MRGVDWWEVEREKEREKHLTLVTYHWKIGKIVRTEDGKVSGIKVDHQIRTVNIETRPWRDRKYANHYGSVTS